MSASESWKGEQTCQVIH